VEDVGEKGMGGMRGMILVVFLLEQSHQQRDQLIIMLGITM
jgi:hypothetical protein